MRIKKELISHLIEYGYLIEKTTTLLIVIGFIVITIIIPAWPSTFINYMRNPTVYGLPSLGNALLTSILLIITGLTAYLIPHFTPLMKPHGFREIHDKRTRNLYLAIISVTLSVTILVYLLFALTLIL